MISKLKAFTLIETLVAVMILSIAVAGPLTIAARGLNSALIAKDQITAFYLAQDAVEFVRFARDSNRLANGDWLTGLNGSGVLVGFSINTCNTSVNAGGCFLDATAQNPAIPTACTTCGLPFSSNRKFLYVSPTSGIYTYNSSAPNVKTIFWRQITLTGVSTREATLTVNVYWSDTAGITRSVTVAENLYNWQ
jgi:prepilin-type N-terminal cleavage/methylation domain-containing protein